MTTLLPNWAKLLWLRADELLDVVEAVLLEPVPLPVLLAELLLPAPPELAIPEAVVAPCGEPAIWPSHWP